METHPDPSCCRMLPWDTEFFGFPVATVIGEKLSAQSATLIDQWCEQHSVKCLYFVARSDDSETVQIAQSHRYQLVDIRITLDRPASQIQTSDQSASVVRNAVPADVPQLRMIAATAHRDGRFHFDPHFGTHVADALYARWIEVSCAGYADAVFVTGMPGDPTGYITCHVNGSTGTIGLVGVSEHARRKGLARQLIDRAIQFFTEKSLTSITVVCHGRGEAAQRLYQRSGFLTRHVQLYYHKWY